MNCVVTMPEECDGGLAAAERALELNPDLAEAHSVKARILSEENRDGEAAREIEIGLIPSLTKSTGSPEC